MSDIKMKVRHIIKIELFLIRIFGIYKQGNGLEAKFLYLPKAMDLACIEIYRFVSSFCLTEPQRAVG
jgi:hypothetical protein